MEEVARLFGYDDIPPRSRRRAWRLLPQDETVLTDDSSRSMLVDLDYQEVITYSFVDPAWEPALDADSASACLGQPHRQPDVGYAYQPVGRPDRDVEVTTSTASRAGCACLNWDACIVGSRRPKQIR